VVNNITTSTADLLYYICRCSLSHVRCRWVCIFSSLARIT